MSGSGRFVERSAQVLREAGGIQHAPSPLAISQSIFMFFLKAINRLFLQTRYSEVRSQVSPIKTKTKKQNKKSINKTAKAVVSRS